MRRFQERHAVKSCASNPRDSAGFTLVELMVAVTIGLMILAAVSQIFATSRSAYKLDEGLARVQENGRFAMDFLTRELREAGYLGCMNINKALNPSGDFTFNSLLKTTDVATAFAPGQQIAGYAYDPATNTWAPPLPPGLFAANEVVPGSDVVVTRRAADERARVTPPGMPSPSADIGVAAGNGLDINDIVLVTDCESADLFQITGPWVPDTSGTIVHSVGAVTEGPGNKSQSLSKSYKSNGEIYKLVTTVFYIGRRNNDPANPPGLFRKTMDHGVMGAGQELVENVESLLLLYGEDTDSDRSANVYRLPSAVADWSRIIGVRLGLLARTPEQLGHDLDTYVYQVAGSAVGPFNDRHERRLFTTTVQLRNLRND
jgi:type IV pilus assembly protein PilW